MPPAAQGARVKASPLARRIAEENGVDLGSLKGSGPGGRIVKKDVEGAQVSAPSTPQPAEAGVDGAGTVGGSPETAKGATAYAMEFVPRITRIVRGVTVPVVANDYVSASRLRGLGTSATLWRDVVPNISGVLIVEFAARLGNVIMFVATLNFLGLGTQPPAASWGLMVSETLTLLRTNPAAPLSAAALIAALAIGVSLLADELAAHLAKDQLGGHRS